VSEGTDQPDTTSATRFDVGTEWEAGIAYAALALQRGELVVLPTDTVYGVGADAFDAAAVRRLLAAKGRGREMPPPVLVPSPRTVDGLATAVPEWARDLITELWPGPLTLVFHAPASLMWDLGDTNGTVALRMPEDDIALAVLNEVGPMAVTSANLTGSPAATTVLEAAAQLGGAVSVYLDGGPSRGGAASTILDCTTESPTLLREGAISAERLQELLGDVHLSV
jgi:L-threonylcarbamoyladenylate synthase